MLGLRLKYLIYRCSKKLQKSHQSLALRVVKVKPSLLAFICAASISTAAVLSSGVRLSLSQLYALYVGQCSCNRHHTGCYRTSRPITGGEKVPVSCHFESEVAYIPSLHPLRPPTLYHHHREKSPSIFICRCDQPSNELTSTPCQKRHQV